MLSVYRGGWIDPFKTWQQDLRKKIDAGQVSRTTF